MDAQAVCTALGQWASAIIPSLTKFYDFPPMEKDSDPPDVVAGVLHEAKLIRDPRFPWSQVQQTGVRVWECELSIMHDPGETNAESATANAYLRAAVAALFAAQEADSKLGGRVYDTAPEMTADYEPLTVYVDGSRGPEVRIGLTVAEPL